MTTDTGEFSFHRHLPVSQEQLWHLVTDAQMRCQWGAPAPGQVLTMLKADFRVGGLEQHHCGPVNGEEFNVDTRWYRIDAPGDAVFTETVIVEGHTIATSLVSYRVAAADTGADLHVHVAVSSFVGREAASEFKAGWETGLDNLAAFAALQSN